MTSIAIDLADGLSSTTAYKGPCKVATTANITLSGEQTVDGAAIVTGDRVLVRAQTTTAENGIYVADTGPWRRAKDFAGNRDVRKGSRVWVTEGDSGPAEYEVTTENPVVVGDDAIGFRLGAITEAAIGPIVQANVPIFASKAAAQGATGGIAAAVKNIQLQFYNPAYANLTTLVGGAPFSRASKADIDAAGYPSLAYWRSTDATDRFMPDGSTDATNGGYWLLSVNYAHPFMFGARGDTTGAAGNGTDDTAAVQACFDYIKAKGYGWAKLTGAFFRTTDTVKARNINVDFDGGVIYYDGTRDRVAVEIGDASTAVTVNRKNALLVSVRSTVLSWASDSYVGVRFSDFARSLVTFGIISGFTRPVQLYALNNFCAYNTFYGGEFLDGRYQMSLTTDGSAVGANEFINENVFWGGRYACSSAANALGSAYGVLFEAPNGGYQGGNNNVWFRPTFELATGAPGDEREPFRWNDCGGSNTVLQARWENCRGYFGRAIGTTYPVRNNDVQISLFSDSGGNLMVPTILETGQAVANRVRTFWYNLEANASASFNLMQCVHAYNATAAAVRGGLTALTTGSADGALFQTNITGRRRSVRIGTNRAIGFFAACSGGETFSFSSETEAGFAGRLGIALYDADGARLTDVSAGAPHLLGIAGNALVWSAAFGGIYTHSADSNLAVFKVSDSVKEIRVQIAPGTNVAYAKKLSLSRLGGYDNNRPLHTYSGLGEDMFARKAAINPSTGIIGRYGIGDSFDNAAFAVGQPTGWKCSTAGWLAAAWAISTAYVVGDLRLNDTDKIYECVTAGTSSGSGGPTGTGSAIADNTVVWNYLGPLAVFQAITASGDLLAANNLSDLADSATARTNLGVEIGADVQAYDPQLSSLVRVNSQSADYTLVLGDGGYTIFHPAADTTARIFTIPANASVPFPIGTVVGYDNQHGAGAITIAITSDTLELVGSAGSAGSRTLATGGYAIARKMTSTLWRISGQELT